MDDVPLVRPRQVEGHLVLKPTCFVAMPITTPDHLVSQYRNDADHFAHLLDCLIRPALLEAGFEVIEPSMRQGEFIHAEVIRNLEECDLVLCDISTLNPNVFMELGIRTSLDRPIAIIRDEFTQQVPFDIQVIGYHPYKSNLAQWVVRDEIPKLSQFVRSVLEKSGDRNPLWQHLGITRRAPEDLKQDSLIIPEDAKRQGGKIQDFRVRALQKIIDVCKARTLTIKEIRWHAESTLLGPNGAYEVKVSRIDLDNRSKLTGDFESIRSEFEVTVTLMP
jgi:hypothetical protein